MSISKSKPKSKSSHKGRNVGGNFFDEDGILVERKTIREYIHNRIGDLDLSSKSIDNVTNRFRLYVKKPSDPNDPKISNPHFHPEYEKLIKYMIKNQLPASKKLNLPP